MPASEMAYPDDPDGTPNPATTGRVSEPAVRSAQLSGEAFGEGTDHGYVVKQDESPFSRWEHTRDG